MFLIFDVGRVVTYSFAGMMSWEVLMIGLLLIPGMVIGSLAGMRLHHMLDEKRFKHLVAVVLLVIDVRLLF
ncbi:hypothetical protein COY95_04485 [Candidatus Woesearchaeota archaeon CG_4_10_14_0_8_um_filter_47_5]|nr:MAG: hypothetical protein COY95_04485 [Candidatus Woesearchaeota archaeon CG_4_10_14_0_8_um_filter_47_5]